MRVPNLCVPNISKIVDTGLYYSKAVCVKQKAGDREKTPQKEGLMRAERAGFEPAVRVNAHTLSKRAPSAARPPLQISSNQYK